MKNRSFLVPLIILLIALSLRLLLVYFDGGSVPITGDAPNYLAIADSLREGKGFSLNGQDPTATRMPLYPLFLAGVLSLPEAGMRTIQFFQALIDSLTCLLVYFLASRLLNKPNSVICGLLIALYVPMASRCLSVYSETLFTFFLVASILLLVLNQEYIWPSGAAGLVMGIGTLVRPNGLVIGIFLVLWMLFFYNWKKALIHSAAFLFCVSLVLAPWVIRNAAVFDRFIPTFTLSGITLYNSYFIPESGLGYNEIKPEHNEVLSINNEAERSNYLTRLTLKHIEQHPLQAIKLIPMKLSLLIYPFDMKWMQKDWPFKYNIFWGIIAALAIVAVVFDASFVWKRLSILFFPLGALLLSTILLYGSPRMRAPFDPLIAVFATVGAAWVWKNRRRYLWIGGIVVANVGTMLLGESGYIIKLLKNLKPW